MPHMLMFRSVLHVLMFSGVPYVLMPCGVLHLLMHRSLLVHWRLLSVVATCPVVLVVWTVNGFGVRRW
ncbi:hypothetical protein ACWFPY_29615 [Nocardia fluminea]